MYKIDKRRKKNDRQIFEGATGQYISILNIRIQNSRHVSTKLTLDNLNGQNFGFPLRPYFSKYAPFFRAVIACE